MGYKQEILRKINNLKEFMTLRQSNIDEALKVDRLIKVYEDAHQVQSFLSYFGLGKNAVTAFGSLEKQNEFKAKNQELFQGNDVPNIHPSPEAVYNIDNVDFEAVIQAIEESTILDEAGLEALYQSFDPKTRVYDLPMTDIVNAAKADADALFDAPIAQELKASLDFANGEMVQKLGQNFVEHAIELNSQVPMIHATDGFRDYVHSIGLDENVVVNHSGNFRLIDPNFFRPQNIENFKPFLQMETKLTQDHQQKIKDLDTLIQQQGILEEAAGGESGFKEYGLLDYFNKQRALKQAITNQAKLQTEDEKRENLIRIDQLAKETKEITVRYDKVLNYIKENFDLDNINLPGNVYGGRPNQVEGGDIDNWVPNMPPRYDYENAKAVVFLNGFTQLKSACQWGEVSLEEYLANPNQAYLKAVENIARKEDAKYYLPRGEENPLGKRLARALVHSAEAYGILQGYNMNGSRGMEFLTNTDPNKEQQLSNTIVSGVIREYAVLFNHNPDRLFGNPYEPDLGSIKNLFAFADREDELYKVSNAYRNKDGNLVPVDYKQALRAQGNVSLDQKYRDLMTSLKDFATERKFMYDHQDQFAEHNRDGDPTDLTSHSLGTLLAAGREYFEDFMLENNLSIASIQDDALREEVTAFMTSPVQTLAKYVKAEDLGNESMADINANFRAVYAQARGETSQDFFQKFNQYNQKPNGYNTGKTFTKCLDDNKGSWWERWRGKTSKQYQTLQKIARESAREGSPIPGDNKALYSAAKAYKEYKMPEGGRTFNQLNSTEKRRIEFCDSIIEAYQAQQREAAAEMENNQPQAENNQIQVDNNQIQIDFQQQLNQDLEPQANAQNNQAEAEAQKSVEKDPPEDEGVQP